MGFSACHPAINLFYFVCVIASALLIDHPIYLVIGYLCAFAYAVRLSRGRGAMLGLLLSIGALVFAFGYAGVHHFGVTVLRQNFLKNNMTLEAVVYGMVLGMMLGCAILWLSCLYKVFTTDKIVYLFGRIHPRLSLFLAILLRMVPRICNQAKKFNIARRGIGRGINQGKLFQRICNALCIFSMLVTWTIEMLTDVSDSMRSRGSSLKGRTTFLIYRFDDRDRAYAIAFFAEMTVFGMGLMLGQHYVRYSPTIFILQPTSLSYAFYLSYAMLCLMPLMLDLYTEQKFRIARRMMESDDKNTKIKA